MEWWAELVENTVGLDEGLELCGANAVPLSDTRMTGKPCVLKLIRSFSMAAAEDGVEQMWTSHHLEYASTTTSSCRPSTGPAKSTCTLCQGR